MPQPPSRPAKKTSSGAVSPSRREAFAILLEINRGVAHSDDLLRAPRVSALPPQDRNLCTALVMGVLRWQIRLDALIRPLLAKPNARLDPEILIALRLGAFQLLYFDRIPAHAAIGESVALARSSGHTFASGMVNAVLRRLAASPASEPAASPILSAVHLAEITAHPLWLVERWASHYGLQSAQAICAHGQRQPPLTIRLASPEIESELAGDGIELAPATLLAAARQVLKGDPAASSAFREGRVQIQDEGSQLIAELLTPSPTKAQSADRESESSPAQILDCCAAPGGKTLILAQRNPQSKITACELSPARCQALRERIAASPCASQIEVLNADATQLPPEPKFDLILADVPCSGTGTLGRNPEIRHRLRLADLARHAARQRDLLRAALRTLRPGGQLLYSTCSLEPEENSQVVAAVLAESPHFRQVSLTGRIESLYADHRLTSSGAELLLNSIRPDGGLTLLPGPTHDGFFAALLEAPA